MLYRGAIVTWLKTSVYQWLEPILSIIRHYEGCPLEMHGCTNTAVAGMQMSGELFHYEKSAEIITIISNKACPVDCSN